MMETFERLEIQELPLRVPSVRRKVEDFLGRNGLRLEEVDLYLGVLNDDGDILAAGGLCRDIIKCIAVSEAARSAGFSVPLISRLISEAAQRGFTNVKVFTKPENRSVFESLGFKVLAQAPKAILMENGRGLEEYCRYLRSHQAEGVVVMNANPFTLGHQYLLEQASVVLPESGRITVIPVKEDRSRFPYSARKEMIRAGSEGLVDVVEGSDYQVSSTTFPTYFLKNLSEASETQMWLDIDLFGRHIAPALGAKVRFVGTEPNDPLTARYNAMMKYLLPEYGVRVVEVPRLCDAEGAVSASRVRACLANGEFSVASALTPSSTHPYLKTYLAVRALRSELDTPLKPGLVGPDGPGAHRDMDYDVMLRGIDAIRPFFPRMGQASSPEELRQVGLAAERAMMTATGGVNTHRGAIFAMALALYPHDIAETAASLDDGRSKQREGIRGAMQMALDGYSDLFCRWLPYYQARKWLPNGKQKTLLLIMSELDDTCIISRVGYERAQEVKREAQALREDFSEEKLRAMCERYAAEGISPGGAADMLALTIFFESIEIH
ncbi:MAG: triphosphoribosyl-dephospho-CoA synthase [Bacteroidales bacterium]|nr:triphosphoribosyl-dephospho-CoA synthase [Bacteroidales bacterium]